MRRPARASPFTWFWLQIAGCLASQLAGLAGKPSFLFLVALFHPVFLAHPAPCRRSDTTNRREWLARLLGPACLAPKGLRHGPMIQAGNPDGSPERDLQVGPREKRRDEVVFSLLL